MNYPIKIPKSHPDGQRLEKAITDLLHFVEAGSIYVSFSDTENAPTIVTFILKKNCGQDDETLREASKKLLRLYPDFVFKFINSIWAVNGFKKGKPYFIEHCTVNEMVYFEPDNKVFYPLANISKELLKKAKKRFHKDNELAVDAFKEVTVHIKNNSSVEAAFAMHQTLRLIYICASEFLTGQFIGTGNLLVQYRRVIDFAPSLKNILNRDVESDKEILIMLNTASSCKQQKHDMGAIEWSLIDRTKTKIELMQKEVCRLFQEYTKTCKQKLEDLSNPHFLGKSIFVNKVPSNYIMDLALSEVSTVIANFFKTRAIFCFGYTVIHEQEEDVKKGYFRKTLPRYHFYLLVLNMENKENAVSLLQSLIREKFQGRYKVTILNHRSHYLRKQSQNQKYFFDTITTNGLLIYNNPLHPIYCKTFGVVRDLEFSKNYWQNRILAAKYFMALIQNSSEPELPLITNQILQQSMKQIMVGLIDLFLGYHPNTFSINYLFSLLNYLDFIELPFDLNIEKERLTCQLLSGNINMLMHRDLKNETKDDSDILYDKCEKFIELALRIGNSEVERIQNQEMD